jgi:type IV fimbrial biogenesis protein FimT
VVTNSKGFTLLELIVIIAILAITMAIAAPGLSTMVSNNRISGNASDFVAALQFAKAEAVARVNPVTLCKSTNLTGCAGNGGWQQGWIVFSDDNGDAAVDDGEEVLLNHETLHPNITFIGTDGVANAITIRPSGISSVTTIETLMICDDRGFDYGSRGILVTMTGRGSVMKASETGQTTCLVATP